MVTASVASVPKADSYRAPVSGAVVSVAPLTPPKQGPVVFAPKAQDIPKNLGAAPVLGNFGEGKSHPSSDLVVSEFGLPYKVSPEELRSVKAKGVLVVAKSLQGQPSSSKSSKSVVETPSSSKSVVAPVR